MKGFLKKLYLKIYTKPLWFSLLIFILLLRLVPIIPIILYGLIYGTTFDEQLSYNNYSDSLFQDILFAGIISPIIETLVAQTFLIWLFRKVCKFNYSITIVLSGFIFGLLHALYSILYAMCASMAGFVFSFSYVFYTKKYSSVSAFWLVAGIHAFHNVSHLIINWLEISL
jgi:hypothetical protein